jgi:hypothetical protein
VLLSEKPSAVPAISPSHPEPSPAPSARPSSTSAAFPGGSLTAATPTQPIPRATRVSISPTAPGNVN